MDKPQSIPTATTPLRSLELALEDGYRLLGTNAVSYADGSERTTFDIIEGADDLTTCSEELESVISDWPTEYHLSPARANALRMLDIPEDARVLEIGCGCGAMTRYLGERARLVDAIEPMPDRARVAASRTRDLSNVHVYLGGVEDVPDGEAYDLVVVWGVLEYVGEGAADTHPYVEFLKAATTLLVPDGQLVLAIENALGVKYLCGSPEDHSARPFDSVEGYPRSTPARTFSRAELREILIEAGCAEPVVLQAMPDYKMTRLLASDELLDDPVMRSVAWEAGSFPSADRAGARWECADERALWRTLVRAGTGGDFGNSFVVIATRDGHEAASPLWPKRRVAAFASSARRPQFRVRAAIEQRDDQWVVSRWRLAAVDTASDTDIRHEIVATEPFIAAPTLSELIAESDVAEVQRLLALWSAAIGQAWSTRPGLLDLSAHNFKVVAGQLVAFDQEWSDDTWPRSARIGRLAFMLALSLMDHVDCSGWPTDEGLHSVEDLAAWIARQIGAHDEPWIEEFIEHECRFGLAVGSSRLAQNTDHDTENEAAALLRARLALPLESGAISKRRASARARTNLEEHARHVENHARNLENHARNLEEHARNLEAAKATQQEQLDAIRASRGWKLLERLRSIRGRRTST